MGEKIVINRGNRHFGDTGFMIGQNVKSGCSVAERGKLM